VALSPGELVDLVTCGVLRLLVLSVSGFTEIPQQAGGHFLKKILFSGNFSAKTPIKKRDSSASRDGPYDYLKN